MTVSVRHAKLWVDTQLAPPDDSWIVSTNYDDTIRQLSTGRFLEVSVGFDLGYSKGLHYTILNLLQWIHSRKLKGISITPIIVSHMEITEPMAVSVDKTIHAWFGSSGERPTT